MLKCNAKVKNLIFTVSVFLGRQPVPRVVQDEYLGDEIEMEMESLFGDVSDNEDPTYLPIPSQPMDQDDDITYTNNHMNPHNDLISLQDLLEDDFRPANGTPEKNLEGFLQPDNEGTDGLLEQDIQLLQEENKTLNETAEIANSILEEVFNEMWKEVKPMEKQQKSAEIVDSILNEILNKVWKQVKPMKRWRKSNPECWTVNVAKRKRADGLPYKSRSKDRPAKVPQNINCSKCKFKCSDHFDENTRNELCRHYWNLDFVGRKNLILANVSVERPKRVLAVKNKREQRAYTKKCYFMNNDAKIQVCQNFFTKTLNIGPSVIFDAVKKRSSTGNFNAVDNRGKHEPSNKTKPQIMEEIRRHIESFPCVESHYTRKDTNKKYLAADLNIRKMYTLYKQLCQEENKEAANELTYRRVFATEYNLSFFVPKKDQCTICTNYENADEEKKTSMKKIYTEHIQRKNKCNAEKAKDKERANDDCNFISVSFDLQAILQIPHCNVSLLYYSRKLCVYNLTIYEAGLPNNAFCFLWSELNGKKGSCEIGTILLHYLSKCVPSNVTEISLFSDTCSGQNRNQYVAAMLLWAVHNIEHLQMIEHKFLESGHTYMEADSMHSAIESQKKDTSVFSMQDWITICQRARRRKIHIIEKKKIVKEPYKTKEFKYHEFYDLKDLASKLMFNKDKDNVGNKVQWLKIKRMRYMKGEKRIYFNYDMSEDFNYMDVTGREGMTRATRAKRQELDFPIQLKKIYKESLPISVAKKTDLLYLIQKNIIPEELEPWYKNLKTANSVPENVEEEHDVQSDDEIM